MYKRSILFGRGNSTHAVYKVTPNQSGVRDHKGNKHQLLHRKQSVRTFTNLQYLSQGKSLLVFWLVSVTCMHRHISLVASEEKKLRKKSCSNSFFPLKNENCLKKYQSIFQLQTNMLRNVDLFLNNWKKNRFEIEQFIQLLFPYLRIACFLMPYGVSGTFINVKAGQNFWDCLWQLFFFLLTWGNLKINDCDEINWKEISKRCVVFTNENI